MRIPIDLLVYTPVEVEEGLKVKQSLISQVMAEGKFCMDERDLIREWLSGYSWQAAVIDPFLTNIATPLNMKTSQ